MPAPVLSPKGYVLDTSALFCLRDNEEGAAQVDKIISHAGNSSPVYVCFASLMEYFYIVYQEKGKEDAFRAYLELKMLNLQIVESDETLRLKAGEIKANFNLSFADAWIAGTAELCNAFLVHKDPEFEPLGKRIHLKSLPYKKR